MSSRHRAQVRPCSAAEKRSLFFTLPGGHRSLPAPHDTFVAAFRSLFPCGTSYFREALADPPPCADTPSRDAEAEPLPSPAKLRPRLGSEALTGSVVFAGS